MCIRDRAITRAEHVLRQWWESGDFARQLKAMEYAFGKVPDKTENRIDSADGVSIKVEYAKGYANFSPDDWDEKEK